MWFFIVNLDQNKISTTATSVLCSYYYYNLQYSKMIYKQCSYISTKGIFTPLEYLCCAVSYTHLDVYKRQTLVCRLVTSNEANL